MAQSSWPNDTERGKTTAYGILALVVIGTGLMGNHQFSLFKNLNFAHNSILSRDSRDQEAITRVEEKSSLNIPGDNLTVPL